MVAGTLTQLNEEEIKEVLEELSEKIDEIMDRLEALHDEQYKLIQREKDDLK